MERFDSSPPRSLVPFARELLEVTREPRILTGVLIGSFLAMSAALALAIHVTSPVVWASVVVLFGLPLGASVAWLRIRRTRAEVLLSLASPYVGRRIGVTTWSQSETLALEFDAPSGKRVARVAIPGRLHLTNEANLIWAPERPALVGLFVRYGRDRPARLFLGRCRSPKG